MLNNNPLKNYLLHRLSFALIFLLLWPIRWLSVAHIHKLGAFLGRCLFYCSPKMRKRTLNNLSLASALQLDHTSLYAIAKQSLENLMITCLEYSKFAALDEIEKVIQCQNPQVATQLIKQGTPVIFFCGHQANWEVLFLEGTHRMQGVAIGRPIKNKVLYRWLLSIREQFGGKIITPQNAIREGLKALKRGAFLGIVGDQGMPDSGFSSCFLGKRAWTSPLPAILAHRTGAPIIVATTERRDGKYYIHYSDPIWPDKESSVEKEIPRMMCLALSLLEESIKKRPGQWLWSHNRWKQQTPDKIKRPYRQESLCVILPRENFARINMHLHTLRELYPLEFITCKVPKEYASLCTLNEAVIEPYETFEELLQPDFRFKLIFNFTPFSALGKHYLKYSAFAVLSLDTLRRLACTQSDDLSLLLKKALLKKPDAS